MHVVFIHGVNVRKDNAYAQAVQMRDTLFRSISMKDLAAPHAPIVYNPYWGDHASTFPFGHAYIPGHAEAFGSTTDHQADTAADLPPVTNGRSDNLICALARQESLLDVIDALWASTITAAQTVDAVQLAEAASRAVTYALKNPNPQWLAQVSNNNAFIDQLLYAIDEATTAENQPGPARSPAPEAFGRLSAISGSIKRAAASLSQRAVDFATSPWAPAAKRATLLRFTRFFGDVFIYVKEGDSRARAIRDTVLTELKAADAARKQSGEKLVVVGHSMGGNIGYDLLTSAASNIRVDLFLTVGSQVALFEELKMFAASSPSIPSPGVAKVPLPANVARWVNVYDPSDPFGYAVSRTFDRAEDYEFDTNAGPLSAHSAYFYKPGFHHRLAVRLKGTA